MNRREFLKNSALTAGAALTASQLARAMSRPKKQENIMSKIPMRTLGKTNEKLSIIGFGGIVVMNAQPEHAAKVVAQAVEAGINYFDVAPSYGNAEEILGPAFEPFRRDCFLACKSHLRTASQTKELLDQSLEKLKTDYFDLYQLHGIVDVEKDIKAALAKGGAMQTILEAKKAGIIKHIGFSAHTPEAAIYAMENFDFDTILYPINFCTHFKSKFDQAVLAEAKKRSMGILALKAMARQSWLDQESDLRKKYSKAWYEPIDEPVLAKMALQWTLAQGVTAMLPPGEELPFRIAMDMAATLTDGSADDAVELEKLSADLTPIFPT